MNQTDKVNQTVQQSTKANPFTTALVVGLGWGLVLGFVDGLPVLLELPILPNLRVRLQALTYLMVWYGLAATVFFGLLGLIVLGASRLLRRETGRHKLVAVYSGIAIGLASLIAGLYRSNVPLGQLANLDYALIALVLVGLGTVAGLIAGLGVYIWTAWWQSGGGFLRPLRWKMIRAGVLAVFLTGVVALSAAAIYRNYLYYIPAFQPKPSGQVATAEQPNVVLITVDALRADHLGIYGYDPEISPNIDALAKRGVPFDQAIAQAPWTGASVPSFITSLHPTSLGISHQSSGAVDMHVDKMRLTLAEVLHDAGYRTQAYITNGFIAPHHWFDQGFDNFAYPRSEFAFDLNKLREQSLVKLVCRQAAGPFHAGRVCQLFNRGHKLLFDRRMEEDSLVVVYGKRFLRVHQDERFFLWLYYMEPHAYYNPPELFRPLPSEITPQRENFLRGTGDWGRYVDLVRPEDLQGLVTLYDSEIAYMDTMVGQVLDELDELGLADRTIVVLNADHGEEFLDHGDMVHGHALYDELVRVPLIISGPGVEIPGQRIETQVRLLDLVPTICELVGAPIPEEAEGRSLVPLLKGETLDELPAFSEALGTNAAYEHKSIRYNGFKLIYNVATEQVELYDLRADPREQVNLAEQEPEIVASMLEMLKARVAQSVQTAAELPRLRPLQYEVDNEMQQRLRDAGY